MAVPAVESSWLLDGVWTGRAALLCHGLKGNRGGITMGGSQGCCGGQLSCCVPSGQEEMEGEAVPLLPPIWEWVIAAQRVLSSSGMNGALGQGWKRGC